MLASAAVLSVVGLATAFQPASADTVPSGQSGPSATFVVRMAGQLDPVTAHGRVSRVGGSVRQELAEGVVADLTPAQLSALQQDPTVGVSADAPVIFDAVPTLTTTVRAATDVFHTVTNADSLAGPGISWTGAPVVAVLDTGIDAALPDFGGRVVDGVDLSGEKNPTLDSYGHGTFVAGLIAGNGASSGGQYTGEAPGATLVPIKVSGVTGAVNISTVIAGVDWAIANKSRLNIGVLNMSLGTSALESTTTSPLNAAVERAWNAGIVVVTSAGNYGPTNGSISKPGDDPLVITAGAIDDNGTVAAGDDTVPTFSSVGPTSADGWFKPDLAVPGRSVVSVIAPGSTIALGHPEGMVGTTNFRGSGTSFSAAITSGAAALILRAHPTATPDNVKGRMLGTASPGPVGNPFVDGHGVLNVQAAAAASGIVFNQANVVRSGQTGPATVPASSFPFPMAGNPSFTGRMIDLGQTWKASSWNGSSWNGSSWNGSSWNGSSWNGSSWNGSSWNGSNWDGSSWNGSSWNGSSWNIAGWTGSSWNGSSWNGSSWNGSSWNGSSWNGSSWNGSSWNGSSWNGSSWNGSSWNGSSWNVTGWTGSSWNGSSWNWSTWS